MASSKSTSKKKPASAAKKSRTPAKKPAASSAARSSPPPAPQPVRREVWGVVFLFLAVFMVISHFNTDGAFIAFFSNYLKGLVGYGFWVVPPAFVLCTYILFTHKGRPVDGRISCALLLPIFFSAIMELATELTPTDGLKFMDRSSSLPLLPERPYRSPRHVPHAPPERNPPTPGRLSGLSASPVLPGRL